jgi:hypothetical protein
VKSIGMLAVMLLHACEADWEPAERWRATGRVELVVMAAEYTSEAEAAAELWAEAAGKPVFSVVTYPGVERECDRVYLDLGSYPDQPRAGRAASDWCRTDITIDVPRARSMTALIAHELGHALGAEHNPSEASAMHESAREPVLMAEDVECLSEGET